jgi:tetratricopeptide (TPR) repeat protein
MGKWSWTCVVVLLLSSSIASADDVAEAKRLYSSGVRHFDLGEFEAALTDFKEGYRHQDNPAFLYNVAHCYRFLKGHEEDAIKFYKSYLRRMPKASNRTEVEDTIAMLQEVLLTQEKAKRAPPAQPPSSPPEYASPPKPQAATITVTAASPAPPPSTPVYKKWWLWTTVGGVVLVGVGVGLGVGLTRSSGAPTFSAVTF